MDTSAQADLFSGNPNERECVSCGDSFRPDFASHQLCDECYDRRRKRDGESNAAWMERFYGVR